MRNHRICGNRKNEIKGQLEFGMGNKTITNSIFMHLLTNNSLAKMFIAKMFHFNSNIYFYGQMSIWNALNCLNIV